MGTTDEERTEMGSVPLCHDILCKKQNPTSNAGAKELGFGTVGGATLVIIKEIIEITEGKKEEEKKEEGVLEKVMTSKK